MPGGKYDAPLLGATDTGARPAMAGIGAAANLDKHDGAVSRTHDQVDFTATAAGRPIIAMHQPQASLLQMVQGGVFCRIAHAFGAGRGTCRPVMRKNH